MEGHTDNTPSAEEAKNRATFDTPDSKEPPAIDDVQVRLNKTTLAFGEIVALLSRSPVYRHMSLTDLEWLVIPALLNNQFSTVHGKLKEQQGLSIPLGLALWAQVSETVDKKLEAQKKEKIPFRLAPHDWKSGHIPWLLALAAPKEVAQVLVKKLKETVFRGQTLKYFDREIPGDQPQEGVVQA